jgi:hypothetical protein
MKRFFAALCFLLGFAGPALAAGYADWAAVVVAGDNRAHSGKQSEVFDNARRDLAIQFQKLGFQASNMRQFSLQPQNYPGQNVELTRAQNVANGLWDVASSAKGGCLIYFTSHGSPDGIVTADEMVPPYKLAAYVNNACGSRPTVVIISACFSGIFVPALAASNRMILTAARDDRTSFGCGEQDTYTFFDTCMLQSLPVVHDFPALAQNVEFCVAQREAQYRALPEYQDLLPSEPQLYIGESIAKQLPPFRADSH